MPQFGITSSTRQMIRFALGPILIIVAGIILFRGIRTSRTLYSDLYSSFVTGQESSQAVAPMTTISSETETE